VVVSAELRAQDEHGATSEESSSRVVRLQRELTELQNTLAAQRASAEDLRQLHTHNLAQTSVRRPRTQEHEYGHGASYCVAPTACLAVVAAAAVTLACKHAYQRVVVLLVPHPPPPHPHPSFLPAIYLPCLWSVVGLRLSRASSS
jgi:hypothetical protein